MTKNEIEIWRAHPKIPGIEASTFGRVRTLDRVVSSERGTRFIKGRILKQYDDGNGYLKVNVPINEKQATKRVHRLVAQTFIHNPDNLPQVNHKDCDRTNNNVNNLEFCSASYNCQYREKFGISSTEARGNPVLAINLKTLEVSRFQSQHEAGLELGLFWQNISAVIRGKQKTAGGFWFTNDDANAADAIKHKLEKV